MTALPKVGTTITVVVKGHPHKPVWVPQWDAFTSTGPETYTHTGTVMARDYWMKTDEFNLSTGLPHFPVRTVSMKNVISINGTNTDQQSTEEKVNVVKIKGSKDNEYEVIVRNGVAETCTCPAFRFRGGRCKHLSLARTANETKT